MNIDGATAVIYAELGFAAPLARGLFVLPEYRPTSAG
jgi:citrate synthase